MGVLLDLGECELAFGDNPDRLCAWCGTALEGRRRRWCSDNCSNAWANNHAWTSARETARRRDGRRCVRPDCPTPQQSIEVNHKVPCLGKHGQNSCVHHLDGLETLCRPHHLEETRRQFGRTNDDQLAMEIA